MKNNLKKFFTFLISVLLFLSIPMPISAEDGECAKEANAIFDSILTYKMEESSNSSVEEWIGTSLPETAGGNAEWYVIALSRMGEYDLSPYEKAMSKYLTDNVVRAAVTRQKYALSLMAADSRNEYISSVLDDSVGEQGVMSFVFALHLLNNNCPSEKLSKEDVTNELLSLQLEDGGWAITGDAGDADVTAMALQALAPNYEKSEVGKAIEAGLEFLAEKQQPDGGYKSYGVANPESSAQVMIALSSLGIDCASDSRFIKNGQTLFDAIRQYRLPDGSFSHTSGGESNENATSQVFLAMVSYLRLMEGKGPIYVFEDYSSSEKDEVSETLPGEDATADPSVAGDKANNTAGYKGWVCLWIVILSSLICVVLIARKKRNPKNFILIVILACAVICVVMFTDIRSVEDFYGNSDKSKDDAVGRVTITIRCDTVSDKGKEHIPDDGVILPLTEIEISDGDTVFDVLSAAASENELHLETNGSGKGVYVEGIANIYEFDFGDLSGWVYRVNGEKMSVSCGEKELCDGDRIEWLYSCALGEDIE